MSTDQPTLTAIDPLGCGCTECMTGEYVPLDKATDDHIRALFRGELRDNTDYHWTIHKNDGYATGYTVYPPNSRGGEIILDEIPLPIPVEFFVITLDHHAVETLRWNNGGTLT